MNLSFILLFLFQMGFFSKAERKTKNFLIETKEKDTKTKYAKNSNFLSYIKCIID